MTPRTRAQDAPAPGLLPTAPHSAREQLIRHATPIFASKGFAAASTREICDAAGVNVASIHYHFGDKEGLYRAVLLHPVREMTAAFGAFDDPALPFEAAIGMFLAPFIATPGAGHDAAFDAHVMKIHMREMLEPSAAFREIVEQGIAPLHQAVCGVVARHCGLAQPDDDIHQLVFALVAMANDYCMSREFMKMLAPGVLDRPRANEQILDRLVGYSRALLDHEIRRRQPAGSPPAKRAATQTARGKQHASNNPKLKSGHDPQPRTRSARKR